jgi:hypothetical protein
MFQWRATKDETALVRALLGARALTIGQFFLTLTVEGRNRKGQAKHLGPVAFYSPRHIGPITALLTPHQGTGK